MKTTHKTSSIYTENYWNNEWKNIFEHYQQDLRHAYYIQAILNSDEKKVLELGAGSFRDAAFLNKQNIDCYGVDYSAVSVQMAKTYFPEFADKFIQADALQLPFDDKSFDFSYSNGVIGCLSNVQILQFFKEQLRVTSEKLAVTVHNAHNKQFYNYFCLKKGSDPLYSVRFFSIEEIKELLSSISNSITIIPVGKRKIFFEDDLINLGLGTPKNIRKSFEYHKMNQLAISERLLCISNLNK